MAQALVRRAAAAQHPGDEDAVEQAVVDPAGWWLEHGDGDPLGYSNLLASLASTPAARRALLKGFFEPTDDELAAGLKVPGPAHIAIAALVRAGFVRVIVTTNFDRLIERALEQTGVSPQVVSRPEAVSGMMPLVHAGATVIKIHGDYADLDLRNTVEELEEYPPAWKTLLGTVFDDYGLVVSGWSAEWDHALVRSIEDAPSRRYPLFWDSRSSRGETAQRVLAARRGLTVPASSADQFFTGLRDRVEAISRLAEAPLTTSVALARLKRYLPDPLRRIDLADLIETATARTAAVATNSPTAPSTQQGFEETIERLHAKTVPLARLLAEGLWHDRDRQFTDLWVGAITSLLRTRAVVGGVYNQDFEQARHYPALLAWRTAGLTAMLAGREDVLLELLVRPQYRPRVFDPSDPRRQLPAFKALVDANVISLDAANGMARWGGTRWTFPQGHLLREDLRDIFRTRLPDDADYSWSSSRYEYRVALLQWTSGQADGKTWEWSYGEFLGDRHRRTDAALDELENDLRTAVEKDQYGQAWLPFLLSETSPNDGIEPVLYNFRRELTRSQ